MNECICKERLEDSDNILTLEEINFLCKKCKPYELYNDNEPEDGVFAIPFVKNQNRYNIRELNKYCLENDCTFDDLSNDELKKFLIKKK